ncbi:MAG: type II toxin-antitoxin system PemK/MazF family toxin [Deltaproteobacteria bacterium]|nr:type II toxin-antitoxin system PemK/MazF family toxin [Deltaproteobacteria bacterium]
MLPSLLVSRIQGNKERCKGNRIGPCVVPIPQGIAGLKQDSVALCHEVTTLNRCKLATRAGALTDQEMTQVEAGLLAALAIPCREARYFTTTSSS